MFRAHFQFAAAFAVLVLCVGSASAHAFLKTATPAVGSTVQVSPAQVSIQFTEAIEPSFSTIAVEDPSGAGVTTGPAHLDGENTKFAVGLKPLQPGTFKVMWHVTAIDTHKTEGSFTFTLAK
jgi:methionine-rich copper-binding protein CopC